MSVFGGPSRDVERATYHAPAQQYVSASDTAPAVTTTSAAQSVAIRSTTDLIASLSSELPVDVYTMRSGKKKQLTTPSNLDDPGGDGRGREDWAYRLQNSWLYTGNAFGVAIDWRGKVLETCDLISPNQVTPAVVDGQPKWWVNGRPVEDLSSFLHWRVNPVPGYLLGLSPIEQAAATIGVSLATTRFGRGWFSDGAHPGGILTNTIVDLDDEQVGVAKTRVLANRGTRDPLVLGKGWEWNEVQISPEESQFIETQGWSEAQCARIFGPGFAELLGYPTGSKMDYGNIVDRRQDLLVLSINRWLRRYERILSLFVPKGQWVEVNRDALLEATTLQRYQAHTASGLWTTVDEIREIEGKDPLPNGAGKVLAGRPATAAPTDPKKVS